MSRFSGFPNVIFNPDTLTFTDPLGQPKVVPVTAFNDPNFRRQFGIPTPDPNAPRTGLNERLFGPASPSPPRSTIPQPGPFSGHGFPGGGGGAVTPTGLGQPRISAPNGGIAEGPALPPVFFVQGAPPAPPPLSNAEFLASDPRRTVEAGSLAGLAALIPGLFGGGGLDLGGFNQALAARQSSALADQQAAADAERLRLRQDLARRGILHSGLAAGAEADISGQFLRAQGATRADILGAGAQADLQAQQFAANRNLERQRLLMQLLNGIPGFGSVLGGIAA